MQASDKRGLVYAVGGAAILAGVCGAAVVMNRPDNDVAAPAATQVITTTRYTPPPTTTTPRTTSAGPATTIGGNGTYLVGTDIQPGTYRSPGGTGSYSCYWSRLSALTGDMGAIIANGGGEGPQVVTILPGDKGFQVQSCQRWTLVPE